jgi:CheY-like chemotaxis protein
VPLTIEVGARSNIARSGGTTAPVVDRGRARLLIVVDSASEDRGYGEGGASVVLSHAGKPKIVVIDDSEIVLEVTRNALESAGYEVVTHDRPGGCVALILHEKPDLVLMDVNMPGLGGDTIVSVFGKAQPNGDTVVLLHSSLSADILRIKAATAGAQGFIQKSGDLYSLVREVNRWLKRGTSSGNMRSASVYSGVNDDSRPSGARLAAARLAPAPSGDAAKRSSGTATPARRSSGTLSLNVPTVLLVDDDMTVLSAYRRQLQPEDLSVEFALSGGQALRRILSETPPDVVICDMLLPDVSGVEVYRRAVAAEPSFRQRFAVATGASTMPSISEFLASFAGPVVKKPVEADSLLTAIRTCLQGAKQFSKQAP